MKIEISRNAEVVDHYDAAAGAHTPVAVNRNGEDCLRMGGHQLNPDDALALAAYLYAWAKTGSLIPHAPKGATYPPVEGSRYLVSYSGGMWQWEEYDSPQTQERTGRTLPPIGVGEW